MKMFLRSDVGRGITGALISIALTLAILFPVIFMEMFSYFVR
ncbi:MAG: hypothetical protein ACFWUE_06730 [Xylanivirga thermophila]|nr:hypothetical protein [Xylanivirga thermophila]